MRTFFLTAIICGIMGQEAFAQLKTTIGILPFTYVEEADANIASTIQVEVSNAFINARRFTIVDRTKMDALRQERELQKSEDFIDGFVVEQGKSLGAAYLVSGHVNAVDASELITTGIDGQRHSGGWRARFSFTIKVIDVATGEITKGELFEGRYGSTLSQATFGAITGASTRESAVARAMTGLYANINEFIAKNFPLNVSIVEFQGSKNVLIAGGYGIGIKVGDVMRVSESTFVDVAGTKIERKKEIGTLTVSKVEENFSICRIKSGGQEIKAKFDDKMPLIIESIYKKK